ncbi:TrkA C-terminal domain-containing protein [Acetobacterium sp.]|uniref:TrkA C-terminal domain-containing protein n=1 Tax=Acetobacterium sp. TaxID=1872094 RepID=UPI002F3F9786
MGFNTSLVSFFILIIAYLVSVEIFTVLFRLTGLKEDKARFQAISCMTNSGFTTKESELILNSVARRHLARMMMIFGYLFAVTGVSILVNLFMRSSGNQIDWWTIVYSVVFLILILTITRSKWIIRRFDLLVESLAKNKPRGLFYNNVRILEMFHDNLIAEVFVTSIPREIMGKTLLEMNFRHTYKLNVLLIKRGNTTIDHVIATDQIMQGDRVFIYGSKKNIMYLFKDEIQKEIEIG